MSVGPDNKKNRLKAITGGKTEPRDTTKSRKRRVTNLTKPHIWVSRSGYGATKARDQRTIKFDGNDRKTLDDALKLVKELETELNKPKAK